MAGAGTAAGAVTAAGAATATAPDTARAFDPVDQLLAWAGPLEGVRALEIRCGDGQLGVRLAAAGAFVTGVDPDPAAIARARRRIARERLDSSMTAQVMPLGALDFPDDDFDLVIGHTALDRADLDGCRQEIARVLRPGGTGIFVEPVCLSGARARARGAGARPLEGHEVRRFLDGFAEGEIVHFNALRRVARRLPGIDHVIAWFDRGLLDRVPAARRFAGICVIRARKAALQGGSSGLEGWS